jgi:hypothetical protein
MPKKILMTEAPGKSVRIILSILALALLFFPFYRAWSIFYANRLTLNEASLNSYSRAIERDPSNGEFWWLRGRMRHFNINSLDIPGAIKDYTQALKLNPRIGQAWLDLADCYERVGETDKAEKALQNALRVWPYSPLTRWQAGNFYLMRGNLDRMYECFKMASAYDLDKLDMAIRLTWKVDSDHAAIYKKLIPDQLPAKLIYLNFLVSLDALDLARPVWEGSLASPIPTASEFKVSSVFYYMDRLLALNRAEEALRVWHEALQKSGINWTDNRVEKTDVNLVWNGSFENEILRGGLDWRTLDSQDFEIQSELEDPLDGLISLKLTFAETNIDFAHFSQIVPILIPGNYQLEFYAKTDNLTTDQRPYILVQGFPDTQSVLARSDMFPESSRWKKYSVPFTIKEETKAVKLTLRREPSQKFGNQIKGILWMDKFSVNGPKAEAPR